MPPFSLPPRTPAIAVIPTTLATLFASRLVQKPPFESATKQFVPDAAPILPSSNHPIGKEPSPVDNTIGYSIVVGDLAGDVTNADLMNVFRNPNLSLRDDFPTPDQICALTEMQGLYCKSHPKQGCNCWRRRVPDTVRKAGNIPLVVSPPPTIQRLRSVTSTVAVSQTSKNNYHNELHPNLVARIAQLSNTMVQHGHHRPQGPHPNKPSILPPPGFLPLRFNTVPTKTPTLSYCP